MKSFLARAGFSLIPGWFDGFARKSYMVRRWSNISSLGTGWFVFISFWIFSFVFLLSTSICTSIFCYMAMLFQAFAFLFFLRKLLLYRFEISFLREFQHLSQTLDELRELKTENSFGKILKAVIHIIGFDRAILFKIDPDKCSLRAVHSYNLDPEVQKQLIIHRNSGPSIAWRVIEEGVPILVNSPSENPEVNPKFLEMLKFTSLALAPITREGLTWGVLVVDRNLRKQPITDEDLLQLKVMADQIAITLQNYALNEELMKRAEQLEKQNARTAQELAVAKVLQEGVLPRFLPDFDGVKCAAFMTPARVIGGDFFDYLDICPQKRAGCPKKSCFGCKNRIQGVLIGDVSGKGIPAAMVMAMVKSLFHEKVLTSTDPAELMTQVNISLKSYLGPETRFFSSAFAAIIDTKNGFIKYANAGHDFPLFLRAADKEIEQLPSTGTLLGIFKESVFENRTVKISSGDRLFMYTDGIIDFFERTKKIPDGVEHLKTFLLDNIHESVENLIMNLKLETNDPLLEREDDISVIMLSIS
ncbi:MAG: SpoIIE family protein phosphatase [Candidatus Riflebacteria bacterium]|nr:SpoIIE family protein phosphatase [Candidatus Riflebacteria bacterium]